MLYTVINGLVNLYPPMLDTCVCDMLYVDELNHLRCGPCIQLLKGMDRLDKALLRRYLHNVCREKVACIDVVLSLQGDRASERTIWASSLYLMQMRRSTRGAV